MFKKSFNQWEMKRMKSKYLMFVLAVVGLSNATPSLAFEFLQSCPNTCNVSYDGADDSGRVVVKHIYTACCGAARYDRENCGSTTTSTYSKSGMVAWAAKFCEAQESDVQVIREKSNY